MGKGSYRGGSTILGPQSGWFTASPKKPRPINKFVAFGDELAAKRHDERINWSTNKLMPVLMSRDEMAAAFPKKERIPIGSQVTLPTGPSKRELRQAAKRKRLGIEE